MEKDTATHDLQGRPLTAPVSKALEEMRGNLQETA